MCTHEPQCPPAGDIARAAAHVISSHPEQGWSLLCNGIVFFDDGGLLLPDGRAEAPHIRPSHAVASEKPTAANLAVHYGGRCGTLSLPPIEAIVTIRP